MVEIKENPKTLATSMLDWFEFDNSSKYSIMDQCIYMPYIFTEIIGRINRVVSLHEEGPCIRFHGILFSELKSSSFYQEQNHTITHTLSNTLHV